MHVISPAQADVYQALDAILAAPDLAAPPGTSAAVMRAIETIRQDPVGEPRLRLAEEISITLQRFQLSLAQDRRSTLLQRARLARLAKRWLEETRFLPAHRDPAPSIPAR